MNRRIVTLAAVFIVLLLVYVVRWLAGSSTSHRASGFVLENLDPAAVAEIVVTHQQDTLHLVKRQDTWLVEVDSAVYRPASENRIRTWLKTMSEARYLKISQNPEKLDLFQVTDEKGIRVRYLDHRGRVLADFYVGKMGPDFTTSYVRAANENTVYLAEPGFRNVFPTRVEAWRERRLLPGVKPEEVVYLKLVDHEAGDTLVLVRDTLGWHARGAEATDTLAARRLVRHVAMMTAIGFADTVSVEDAGLTAPRRALEVSTREGTVYRIQIGNLTPNGRGVYARREGQEGIVILSKYMDDQLAQLPQKIRKSTTSNTPSSSG